MVGFPVHRLRIYLGDNPTCVRVVPLCIFGLVVPRPITSKEKKKAPRKEIVALNKQSGPHMWLTLFQYLVVVLLVCPQVLVDWATLLVAI